MPRTKIHTNQQRSTGATRHPVRRPAHRRAPVVAACVLLGCAWLVPVGVAAQSQLVWENEYANGAPATPVTIDGTTVSIVGIDAFLVGSPGNFTVNYGTRGAHTGYWESGLDANTQSDFLTITMAFSQSVESLEFSLLDIDTNDQFHDSITVVGWNGTTAFAPTTIGLGVAVAQVGPGAYSGLASIGNSSPDANVDLRFDQLVDSVTFVYGPGPRASANPNLQVLGFSDLSWTLPCVSTVSVGTTAELRAAVANPCVALILMSPGLFDLTDSGSGHLLINQDKTLRNVGGGEVVIDAAGASRVMDIRAGITVELDGLTISGGNAGNGAGVRSRADLTLRNSTITGNTGNNGGGLFHRSGSLLMENVTVSGNSVSGSGGGLDLRAGAQLVHVTVAGNSAGRGGGLRSRSATVSLANTLVADNPTGSGGQIRGTISSLGVNLVEGGCSGCSGADLTADPSLLPLASNGGDTRTHALAPASIAIDAGSPVFGLPTDQRDIARPIGPGFDIGAYEAPLAYAVDVSAAQAAADRLPSNGTTYSEAFTVTNTGPASSAYTLQATSAGSAVAVDSIRGPGVTFGAPADSARTANLAGSGGSVSVSVFYTVADVAAGTDDPVTLTATSVVAPSVDGSDLTTVSVVRPLLGLTKLASVVGDTVPGAPVTYQMTVTNLGTEAAALVELVDSLPAEVDYVLGSISQTLPSGIGVSLAFDDGTDSWTYTPVPAGCGAAAGNDRCVRAIRWTLDAPLPATAPDNAVVFGFTAGIR